MLHNHPSSIREILDDSILAKRSEQRGNSRKNSKRKEPEISSSHFRFPHCARLSYEQSPIKHFSFPAQGKRNRNFGKKNQKIR